MEFVIPISVPIYFCNLRSNMRSGIILTYCVVYSVNHDYVTPAAKVMVTSAGNYSPARATCGVLLPKPPICIALTKIMYRGDMKPNNQNFIRMESCVYLAQQGLTRDCFLIIMKNEKIVQWQNILFFLRKWERIVMRFDLRLPPVKSHIFWYITPCSPM
jgi:hypothetical protein